MCIGFLTRVCVAFLLNYFCRKGLTFRQKMLHCRHAKANPNLETKMSSMFEDMKREVAKELKEWIGSEDFKQFLIN